ncbi:MAG: hypothetical protein AB7R69_01640 [Candidatus Babeliales bacterium]
MIDTNRVMIILLFFTSYIFASQMARESQWQRILTKKPSEKDTALYYFTPQDMQELSATGISYLVNEDYEMYKSFLLKDGYQFAASKTQQGLFKAWCIKRFKKEDEEGVVKFLYLWVDIANDAQGVYNLLEGFKQKKQ